MSPRKTILRELSNQNAYTRPSTIPGFSQAPEKYQQAVNALLRDRLLEGRKDEEGHMTIAINEHRRADVRKELRPIWAHPAVWVAVVVMVAVGAGFAI